MAHDYFKCLENSINWFYSKGWNSACGLILSATTWTCPLRDIENDVGDAGISSKHNIYAPMIKRRDAALSDVAAAAADAAAAAAAAALVGGPNPRFPTWTRQNAAPTFSWALVSFFWTLLATFPAVSPFPKFNSAILVRFYLWMREIRK